MLFRSQISRSPRSDQTMPLMKLLLPFSCPTLPYAAPFRSCTPTAHCSPYTLQSFVPYDNHYFFSFGKEIYIRHLPKRYPVFTAAMLRNDMPLSQTVTFIAFQCQQACLQCFITLFQITFVYFYITRNRHGSDHVIRDPVVQRRQNIQLLSVTVRI